MKKPHKPRDPGVMLMMRLRPGVHVKSKKVLRRDQKVALRKDGPLEYPVTVR